MKYSRVAISAVITLAAAFTYPKSVSLKKSHLAVTTVPSGEVSRDDKTNAVQNDLLETFLDDSTTRWVIHDLLLQNDNSSTSLRSGLNSNEYSSRSDINDKKREFELNVGKAIDTLRKDYPDMLTRSPDFTIYDKDIEIIDPSGVTLHSLQSYKTSFRFLHMVIKLFYCTDQSGLKFRLIYDCARKNVRVSWNAFLVPRAIYGGTRNKLHVDGISVYELDRSSGLISQHRVERLLVNDMPVSAPQGIFHAIAMEANANPDGIPVWNFNQGNIKTVVQHNFFTDYSRNDVVKYTHSRFPKKFNWSNFTKSRMPSMLYASSSSSTESSSPEDHPLFDLKAFESKNQSRKKFGLQPITPDEFIQIQLETKELEIQQQRKAAEIASSSAAEMTNKKESFTNKIFGNLVKSTCENNWDCQRPEVCCDFGFKKMCCRSGQSVFGGLPNQKLTRIPVRVVAGRPRGGPDSDGMRN